MIYLFNANVFFWVLCTEICLLTGKYENVIAINSRNESDMCNEPDFAIISTEEKKKFLFGSLASGFFCYLAVMLSLLILHFDLIYYSHSLIAMKFEFNKKK